MVRRLAGITFAGDKLRRNPPPLPAAIVRSRCCCRFPIRSMSFGVWFGGLVVGSLESVLFRGRPGGIPDTEELTVTGVGLQRFSFRSGSFHVHVGSSYSFGPGGFPLLSRPGLPWAWRLIGWILDWGPPSGRHTWLPFAASLAVRGRAAHRPR